MYQEKSGTEGIGIRRKDGSQPPLPLYPWLIRGNEGKVVHEQEDDKGKKRGGEGRWR